VHEIVKKQVTDLLETMQESLTEAKTMVQEASPPTTIALGGESIQDLKALLPALDQKIDELTEARHQIEEGIYDLRNDVIDKLQEKVKRFTYTHQSDKLNLTKVALKRAEEMLGDEQEKVTAILEMSKPFEQRRTAIQRRIHALTILAQDIDIHSDLPDVVAPIPEEIDAEKYIEMATQPPAHAFIKTEEDTEEAKQLAWAAYSLIPAQRRSAQRISNILLQEMGLIAYATLRSIFFDACYHLTQGDSPILSFGIVGAHKIKIYQVNRTMPQEVLDQIIPPDMQVKFVKTVAHYAERDKERYSKKK
jgi:hypothetical protein